MPVNKQQYPIGKPIGKRKVKELTGLNYSKINRLIRLGAFPLQMEFSFGFYAWCEDQIQNWILECCENQKLNK